MTLNIFAAINSKYDLNAQYLPLAAYVADMTQWNRLLKLYLLVTGSSRLGFLRGSFISGLVS